MHHMNTICSYFPTLPHTLHNTHTKTRNTTPIIPKPTHQTQTTLTRFTITPSEGRHGDAFHIQKQPQTFRLFSSNLINIPAESYKQKAKAHITALTYYNVDASCEQETGVNFHALDAEDTMEECVRFLSDS